MDRSDCPCQEKTNSLFSLLLCLVLLCSVSPLHCSAEEFPQLSSRISHIEGYGHADLEITPEAFDAAGFALGDIVTVSVGSYTGDMPYLNGYYVDRGEHLLHAYPGTDVIAVGRLYRSSSPVDNRYDRAAFSCALAEQNRINAVMNLASTEEEIVACFAAPDFASAYYRELYESGRVILLGLPINFDSAEFAKGIVRGLTFLSEQDPPYLVHCTEGKDRAGFASMVLEALTGGGGRRDHRRLHAVLQQLLRH